MLGIFLIIGQLLLITAAVYLADYTQNYVDFIPKAVVRLPEVDYTPADFRTVLAYFLITHAVVFSINQLIQKPWVPNNPRRMANELFALATAFSLAALLLFVTTSIAFDPNFIVGIAFFSAGLFILTGIIHSVIGKENPAQYTLSLILSILRRAFTPSGALILLFAVSPGIMAKLFVSDKDFANTITRIRIYFSDSVQTQYHLANALNGQTFSQPMLVKESPDSLENIYVLERAGRLISVEYPSGSNSKVVLDISNKVGPAEIENGALGFTFIPGEQPARHVYIYYTSVSGKEQTNFLSRFDLGESSLEKVSASEVILLRLPRENSGFHNGGSVEFGPDGYLYLAIGEGVHPKGITSQSETLRSGILRLDVSCTENGNNKPPARQPAMGVAKNYCIPADNPFVNDNRVMPEFWATGLRNPYRMQFDQDTGELWVGDVGSTKWEEVNLIEKGKNYQFPWVEGYEETGKKRPDFVPGEEMPPVYTYIHTAYDRAVIGGGVYRGSQLENLRGKYIFADNYSSKLFSMDLSAGEPVIDHIATADQFAQRGTSSVNLLSNGDILLTTLGRSAAATGEVLRLFDQDDDVPIPQPVKRKAVSSGYTAEEIVSVYTINCARCHGMEGRGDGPDSPALGIELPDFSDTAYQSSRSDEQLEAVIRKGGYALEMSPMMPAWEHLLDDEEIAGIVQWIRSRKP